MSARKDGWAGCDACASRNAGAAIALASRSAPGALLGAELRIDHLFGLRHRAIAPPARQRRTMERHHRRGTQPEEHLEREHHEPEIIELAEHRDDVGNRVER